MPQRSPRLDWSRPLPRPLVIPTVITLTTLADVRDLIGHLPAEHRTRSTWRYVEAQLAEAARGTLDAKDVAAALSIEGVTCHPK